ncbi:SPFH domain-containing protein [Spirochaeta lutea]|uniref:Protease n=1 Tax=Spirochaeta lutea TaxID=1480694 RepID=A0A098QWI1_9SPIO|nr:stomatin-like protein [Spirochaeta lutea]KGE71906.1 protease [Spirochaeta lutea]
MINPVIIVLGLFGFVVLVSILRSIRIVPAQQAQIVERLGKYAGTLQSGFHILVPFIDKVRYHHSLKEQAVDVPVQTCFTHDNVKIQVDGVLYYRVVDPKKASYGITNFQQGTVQLAQTTMRSVIGKLELDKSFEERDNINAAIVREVDEASDEWGVKVTRYEIKNIEVPRTILGAMEVQMKAEREKRALIARSLGEKESKVNYSQGIMTESVNRSEGEKQKMINEAEGRAAEIRAIARATATSIKTLAQAISVPGGPDAVNLQLAEQYIHTLNSVARKGTKVVLPMDLTDMEGTMETLKKLTKN